MGHRKLAGRVSEETIAGAQFLRLDMYGERQEPDIPVGTQFYSAGSLYCLTPATEDLCRGYMTRLGVPKPVSRFELPAPAREESGWAGTENGDEYD